MRRTTPIRIGELWEEFIKSAPKFAARIAEAKVPRIWAEIAGNRVAMYTTSIEIVKGVMYVKVSSAAARSEVFLHRTEYKDRINETLGTRVVNVIIVK